MVKAILIGFGVLVALAVGAVPVAAMFWPRINDVRTGATPEYPDVRPQRFSQSPERVHEAALAVAQARGWEVTNAERERGTIAAVATTRAWRFKDDIDIDIAADAGATIVNVRSRSRVGKSDFGTNARRIRAFQAQLAERIAARP